MPTTVLHNEIVRQAIIKQIERLPADGSMKVEIRKNNLSRSDAQNRLMWMWFGILGREIGYTKDEIHDIMCRNILGEKWVDDPVTKKAFAVVRGTSDLKQKKDPDRPDELTFSEFLGEVERVAAELGILLPHPEDLYYKSMGYV